MRAHLNIAAETWIIRMWQLRNGKKKKLKNPEVKTTQLFRLFYLGSIMESIVVFHKEGIDYIGLWRYYIHTHIYIIHYMDAFREPYIREYSNQCSLNQIALPLPSSQTLSAKLLFSAHRGSSELRTRLWHYRLKILVALYLWESSNLPEISSVGKGFPEEPRRDPLHVWNWHRQRPKRDCLDRDVPEEILESL